jgi:deoxycytidylate deaminase
MKKGLETTLKNELVIALTAPLGVDLEEIKAIFDKKRPSGYKLERIKLSDVFKKPSISKEEKSELEKALAEYKEKHQESCTGSEGDKESYADKYLCDIIELKKALKKYIKENDEQSKKITQGNLIVAIDNYFKEFKCKKEEERESLPLNNKMAQIAINKISEKQEEISKQKGNKDNNNIIYLIQSLKRPEEIKLLKQAYGRAFYVLGVFSGENERREKIKEKLKKDNFRGDIKSRVEELMEKDQNEEYKFGQKIEKTFSKADYFIHADHSCPSKLEEDIERFLNLILNDQFITPTREEVGMCYAYVASMRSADLSRQVGASIIDDDCAVLSVGTNDVPKAGGDLYWPEDGNTHRDMEKGKDFNSEEKIEIAKSLIEKAAKKFEFSAPSDNEEYIELLKGSQLDNLIEFGRAVHAETDAIISAARRGVKIRDAILYTTTFPCHLCIKHIIDAGIKEVIYIHPYPKSKAIQFHSDELDTTPRKKKDKDKVQLRPFEGVSPLRYFDLFSMTQRKSDSTGMKLSRSSNLPKPRLERDVRGEKEREKELGKTRSTRKKKNKPQ